MPSHTVRSARVSLVLSDTLRNIQAARLAVLIPKQIKQYPSNADKVKGTIDVWWIVRILATKCTRRDVTQLSGSVQLACSNLLSKCYSYLRIIGSDW